MGFAIDRYQLNLYCTCLQCANLQNNGPIRSCKGFPKKNGIPPEVWNGRWAECDKFVEKEDNN